MPRLSLVFFAAMAILVSSNSPYSRNVVAEDKPAKKGAKGATESAEKLSDEELMKQWAELVARREATLKAAEGIRDDFESAKTNEDRKKVEVAMLKLRAEFEKEIQPGLLKLGPLVFKKKPTDSLAAQVVIGSLIDAEKFDEIVPILKTMAKGNPESRQLVESILQILYKENRFSDVVSVADQLAAAEDAESRLLMLDALAHFNNNDFDNAKALAARAAKDPASSKGAVKVVADCEQQAELWKKEQAIRSQEAKADDLPRVVFNTTKGEIVLELFENEAPNTVANFISLVEGKKYDGIKFHRVIPGFMAQGGDPNTLDDDPSNDGQGGPGYTIPCECYSEKARMHFQGSLSMAHAGKDTGGSQFFLTYVPTTHLNWAPEKDQSNHTVFGRIIKGMNVALSLKIGDEIKSAKVIRKRDHAYSPEKQADKKKR